MYDNDYKTAQSGGYLKSVLLCMWMLKVVVVLVFIKLKTE